jgi:uncharacterized membrane protein YheB (UPF0754 family)|tara:strand:- start:95 stop:331 length:237 start_codon:yes stop_codon:yes gene_type:complete
MKRLLRKYKKFVFKYVFEIVVKHIQSSAVEEQVAKVLVSKMPKALKDKVTDKQSLKMATASIDAVTDKIAESLGYPAD